MNPGPPLRFQLPPRPGDDDFTPGQIGRGCLLPFAALFLLIGVLALLVRFDEIRTFACNRVPDELTCGSAEYAVESRIRVDAVTGAVDFTRLAPWTHVCLTTQYMTSDDHFEDALPIPYAPADGFRHQGRRIAAQGRLQFRLFGSDDDSFGHSVRLPPLPGAMSHAEYGGAYSVPPDRQCARVPQAIATCEPLGRLPHLETRCIYVFRARP